MADNVDLSTHPIAVVNVGDRAPEFALPSLEGHEVRLSDYNSRRLVLFMWASW